MTTAPLSERLTARVADAATEWVRLPILAGVRDGSLDPAVFRNYLEQDYLYLQYYARIYARLAAAAASTEEVQHFLNLATSTLAIEIGHHVRASEPFGCDFESAVPSPELEAYIAYYDELGSDRAATLVAMLPCTYGYGVALGLVKGGELGPYLDWVEMYTSGAYADVMARHLAMVDAAEIDADRAFAIIDRGLALEHAFWNQAPAEVRA